MRQAENVISHRAKLTVMPIGDTLLFKTTMTYFENFDVVYTNVREAAKQLGIHEESLRRLLRMGSLPGKRIGGQWFIKKEQLALFAATYDARTGKRRHLI